METLAQVIRRLELEEQIEYIVVPYVGRDGKPQRAYFLKRPYLRIVYPDRHSEIFPLTHLLDATVRRPDEPISQAIELFYEETGIQRQQIVETREQEPSSGLPPETSEP